MNYITFKKMFDYVDRIEKARSHKYIDRRPKKTGKGWYYIYAETFKKPFRALLEIFDIKKERIDKDYEEDNIQKDFGVDKNLYASHVLEFFLNREKWHNIFSKKENRQKYTQAVKQSDVEKKAKEKKEKSTEKKKTTTETTKTQKLNRSLMFRIWKRNTPEAEKLLEQDKENINDEDKQQLEDLKHRAWANRAGSYEYTDRNGNIIRGETGLSGGMMKGKYSDEVAELAKMSKEELEAEKKRLEGIVSDSYYFSTRQAASRVGSHVKAMAEAETKLNKVKQVLRRFRKKTRDKQPAGKEGATKESGNEYIYSKKKFSDFIDNFVANGYKSDKSVNLLDSTPSILKEHGFPDNPISITPNIMKKILVDESKAYHGHNLPVEILKDLPNQLEEPVYILKGKDSKKVIVTEHNIENNPVIAILELDRNEGRITVNSVRSLYDKNNKVFAEWINNPNIVEYEDKEKSKALLQSIGLQSPKEVTTPNNENISESNSDVNGEHGNKEAMLGNDNAKKYKGGKKTEALIDFVRRQTTNSRNGSYLDLNKYIRDEWSKRGYLNVRMQDMTRNEQVELQRLAIKHPDVFTIEDNGGLGMALVYGNKLHEQDKERTTEEGNSVEQIRNTLKADFKNKAIEKPQIEYSRENYDKLFPRGNIKTPIGHVKLGENQYEKLKAKSREDLLGVVAETLKNPLVIINENGSHIYAKSFVESGKTKSYQSVVIKIDGKDISISTHQRDTNNILNKIKKAEDVIYTNDSQQLPSSRNALVVGTTRETDSPQLPGTWNKPEMAGTTRETKLPHFDSQNVNPNEVSDNSEEMSSTEHGNKEAMKGNDNAKKDLTDGELAVRLNLAYLNGILEKNHIQTIENPQIGEISVEAGKTGKHGYGLKHIIEQRFKKDGKNENEIAALIMLVADAAGSGEIRNNNGNRIEIVKNGIMAIVSKERNGKKENWLLTGYDLFDEKEKATDTINEVISRYGYTPGFSGLKTQVGAVIASLEDYTSKETNVNGEHGNKEAMKGNQNAKKFLNDIVDDYNRIFEEHGKTVKYRDLSKEELLALIRGETYTYFKNKAVSDDELMEKVKNSTKSYESQDKEDILFERFNIKTDKQKIENWKRIKSELDNIEDMSDIKDIQKLENILGNIKTEISNSLGAFDSIEILHQEEELDENIFGKRGKFYAIRSNPNIEKLLDETLSEELKSKVKNIFEKLDGKRCFRFSGSPIYYWDSVLEDVEAKTEICKKELNRLDKNISRDSSTIQELKQKLEATPSRFTGKIADIQRDIKSEEKNLAQEVEERKSIAVALDRMEQDKENINDEDKQQLEDLKHRAWANRAGSYEYTDRNGNIIRGETGLSGGMMKGKYSDEVAELAKMSKEELEAEKKRLEGIVSDSYYFSTRQAASRVGSHVKAMAEAETKLNKVKQVLRRFRKKTQDKQPAGKEGVTKESGNERTYNKKKFSDLTDEEKQQKKKQIRSNIVSKVKIGIIHKTEDKRASDVAYEWVDENIKGDIFTVIGNVKFNRKTVKEDLSHGFGQEKLDTLTAVKDVLEKGTYLGYERNFQGETNENHYFAGKIKYGNDEKIVFCRVKDSAGGNSCFYVHEVFTEDEIKSDLPRLGVRETDSSRLVGKPLYKFILQTIFNVNDDNIIRKAIFLSKLNHEFCKLVEREKRKEAYLDKLGRGYIAYLKKHHPELV